MNPDGTSYTLEDLCQLVAARIEAAGLAQNNRQVSGVPDGRTLRYYTTLGLMDRPTKIVDRRARYTDRHVDQVTAVKRLQSDGRSLGEIQTLLLGLSPADLHEVAEGRAPRRAGAQAEGFWSLRPSRAANPPDPDPNPNPDALAAPTGRSGGPSGVPPREGLATTVTGIPLNGSLTLLMPTPTRPLSTEDLEALDAVAQPLIDELVRRGLLDLTSKESQP